MRESLNLLVYILIFDIGIDKRPDHFSFIVRRINRPAIHPQHLGNLVIHQQSPYFISDANPYAGTLSPALSSSAGDTVSFAATVSRVIMHAAISATATVCSFVS